METEPKPNINSVLRKRNLEGIEKAVMSGELPFADLQKTIAFNQQLEKNEKSQLPQPEIEVAQPKTSEFILPDGQSIELPTRPKRILELVFLADQEGKIISNEEIHLLSPFISISSARGNVSRTISSLRKQLEEKGWEIEKGKNGIWKPSKIEKPDPKTSSVELTQPDIKVPETTSNVIPLTPKKEKKDLPKESEEMKKLRIKVTKRILAAIVFGNLKSFEKSPDKFLLAIGNKKSNSAIEPEEIDKLRRFILNSVIKTIIELAKKDPETLSESEEIILNNLGSILKDEDKIGSPKKRIKEVMKSIEEHFAPPPPTSSPEPETPKV